MLSKKNQIRFAGEVSPANRICRISNRGYLGFVLVVIVAILLPACQNRTTNLPPPMPKWQYTDLRALDPADAPTPGQDLVALSLRHEQEQVQIRLDWLDIGEIAECDVYIHFFAGASDEPSLSISLPASGGILASRSVSGLRVYRDLFYDTWFVVFNIDDILWLHAQYKISIESVDKTNGQVVDQIGPLASDAPAPPPVPILLAFWNTFSASTPAQAIRQWDGAHTGPLGDRHGLRYLLMAAEATHTPIFLLDIKTPSSLSALDFVGGLATLQRLEKEGLAILPDAISLDGSAQPEWANQQNAADSRQAGLDFGLPASLLLYAPVAPQSFLPGYEALFTLQTNAMPTPHNCQGQVYFLLNDSPLHGTQATANFIPQASGEGPALSVRQLLANAHLYNGYTQLGGDFTADTWGMPQAAQATLRYLAARPWLQVLDENDVQQITATEEGCSTAETTGNAPIYASVLAELARTPDNQFKRAAWQMYTSLQTPVASNIAGLRHAYSGQVGHLLAAARWVDNPRPITDCSQDIDWDGDPECQLASQDLFAVIERQGGYVSIAAVIIDGKPHQVIAPSWQFTVGLSDPMEWRLEDGVAADPGALPGAFFDPSDKWIPYTVTQDEAGKIILLAEGSQKTFWVENAELLVNYEVDRPHTERLSFALDGWRRFAPSWWQSFQGNDIENGWEWSLASGIKVTILAESPAADIQSISFGDSQPYLSEPEDPNFAYPAGHYLPFPLTTSTIDNPTRIRLRVEALP